MSFPLGQNFRPLIHAVPPTLKAAANTMNKSVRLLHPGEVAKLPLPFTSSSTQGETSLPSVTANVTPSARNIRGLNYLTDGSGGVYVKLQGESDPGYFPPGAAKPHVSISKLYKQLKGEQIRGLATPARTPKQPLVGKMSHLLLDGKEVNATVIGFDGYERPIVQIEGRPSSETRIMTDPEKIKAFVPEKGEYITCAETLVNGKVFTPSPKLTHLLDFALTRPIVGRKTGMDYVDWLHKHGSEVFVLGGAVRDICNAFAANPNLTQEEAAIIVNDIDVSVVGGAPTAKALFHEVHGDDPNVHVAGFAQFGCFHAKSGAEGAGFDFNAMMIGNHTYDPAEIHPDIPDEGLVVPAKFGGQPERCAEALDFCCNSLMYDPINGVIIDPTGYGLEDSLHGFLRLTGGEKLVESPEATLAFKQPDLMQRFWKFRYRGMNSNAYTTLFFQKVASNRWSDFEKKGEEIRIYNDVKRMLPIGKLVGTDQEKRVQLEEMLDNLGKKMDEDEDVSGVEFKLFETYINPPSSREAIFNYILNLKKPMP